MPNPITPDFIYRVMIPDPDDPTRPLIGETHLTLGPRIPWDVVPNASNFIAPTGPDRLPQGIAVSSLPKLPPKAEYPLWQLKTDVLATLQLAAVPHPAIPSEEGDDFVLATLGTVSWPEYWYHIAQTQKLWQQVGPPVAPGQGEETRSPAIPLRQPSGNGEIGEEDMSKKPSGAASASDCVRSPLDKQPEGAIHTYWTPQREQSAIPKPLGRLDDPEIEQAIAEILAKRAEQYRAEPVTNKVASASVPPYAAVGKLFFDWEGKAYTGSAWLINSKPQGIITAAHNVYDYDAGQGLGPSWSTSIRLKLQFDDDYYAEEWEIEQSILLKGWFDSNAVGKSKNFAYDFAVLVPKTEVKDQPALDVLIDETAGSYRVLGYPGRPLPKYDFQGKVMWESSGAFINETKGVVAADNNLTQGSSGGPWCARRMDEGWVANGVQSFRGSDPDIAFSPYFAEATFGALLACGGLVF